MFFKNNKCFKFNILFIYTASGTLVVGYFSLLLAATPYPLTSHHPHPECYDNMFTIKSELETEVLLLFVFVTLVFLNNYHKNTRVFFLLARAFIVLKLSSTLSTVFVCCKKQVFFITYFNVYLH